LLGRTLGASYELKGGKRMNKNMTKNQKFSEEPSAPSFKKMMGVSVGVALIVAIVAAAVTTTMMTGPNYSDLPAPTLASAVTAQQVLNMLNAKCSIWSVAVPNSTRQVTGDDICKERNGGTCILTINYDRFSSNDMIQKCTPYVTGRSDTTVAYCCSP